jgi:hypothetical protein
MSTTLGRAAVLALGFVVLAGAGRAHPVEPDADGEPAFAPDLNSARSQNRRLV